MINNDARQVLRSREWLWKQYWLQEKSLSDIAKSLDLGETSVRRWMARHNIPRRPSLEAFRKKVLIKPRLNSSPALAYVLGTLLGDGYVRQDGEIVLEQCTASFAKSFEKALKELQLNPNTYNRVRGGNRKRTFCTIAYSKIFSIWYKSLSIDDIQKLLTTSKEAKAFVRGFFEAEGSNEIRPHNWQVGMYNKNLELLLLVQKLCTRLGFNFKLRKRRDSTYALLIYNWQQCRRFIETIKPCVKNRITDFKRKIKQIRKNLELDTHEELTLTTHHIKQ